MGTQIKSSAPKVEHKAPAKSAAKAAPKPAEKKAPQNSAVKSPTDKASVSGDAKAKADPGADKLTKAFGDAYGTSKVKTDTWKKGPNDSIEGMLKGKGFSLKDIYTKGQDGKNMVDKVMSANNIKDAKKIKDGQELNIPDLGKNGGGTATAGLKPGEKTEAKQVGDHKIQSEKLADGTNQSSVETKNGSDVKVQSPGNSTNATQVKPDGSTSTQTLAKNEQGKVTTEVDTTTKGNTDTIQAKTLDGGTLKGKANQDGVQLQNGSVKVTEDLDERKRDGAVENFGAKVDKFFGMGPQGPSPSVDVQGKNVTTTAVGNDITVQADGKQVAKFNQDADDGFFERTGAAVDKGVKTVSDLAGRAANGAVDLASRAGGAISNAASGLWNWIRG
ncbi:hypothetical protein JST97_00135 [bacterium]|nr:hypothetical protein [bacterium]